MPDPIFSPGDIVLDTARRRWIVEKVASLGNRGIPHLYLLRPYHPTSLVVAHRYEDSLSLAIAAPT